MRGSFLCKALACAAREAPHAKHHPLCGCELKARLLHQTTPPAGTRCDVFKSQGFRDGRVVRRMAEKALQPVAHEVDVQVPHRVHAEV